MMMNNISWRAAEYVSLGENVSSPCPHLSFVLFFFQRDGMRERGGGQVRRESKVDNHHHCVHTHPSGTHQYGNLPLQPPKHFHINNRAIFLHANPSKRAGANLQAWGWLMYAASSFQVCSSQWQTFVPLCGTQSLCPVSTDWSEAGCKGGKQHTLSMMLYICTWKSLHLLPQCTQCRR